MKQKYITGKMYLLNVSNGMLYSIHGFAHPIKELFIPSKNIFLNYSGCYRYHKDRYKNSKFLYDVKILTTDVMSMDKYLINKDNVDRIFKQNTKLFNIKQIYKCSRCGDERQSYKTVAKLNSKRKQGTINACLRCDGYYSFITSEKQ